MTTEKQALAEKYAVELAEMARNVIAANRYLVLGTAHPDGHPRVSPVYFNHDDHRHFYWVSAPDSQHARNIAADSRVNAVAFDSSLLPGQTGAVYLTGTAIEVPEADLAVEAPRAFLQVRPPVQAMTADELSGPDAELRLHRLDVDTAEVHARGGHPEWGMGIDTRLPVTLG